MGTYSNHTCHNCQIKRSAFYMKQIEVRQKSGQSGWRVSFSPKRKKNVRIKVPRNYYSIRKKWVCADEDACHNPQYYVELEKRRAAERAEQERYYAEQERLQKIEDQKEQTKSSIKSQIKSYLTPSIIARRATILKPLIDDPEIKSAFSEMKKQFKGQMRSTSDKNIIAEIIRQGDIVASFPLKSMKNIKFEIPSHRSSKEIVSKFFFPEKRTFSQTFLLILRWVLARIVLIGCLLNLLLLIWVLDEYDFHPIVPYQIGTLVLLIFLGGLLYKETSAQIQKEEIKKIADLISRFFHKTPLLKETLEQLKSDDELASLPYFYDCYPEVIGKDAWQEVKVSKPKETNSKTKTNTKTKSETNSMRTLREIYESDEFFDICMIVLMRAVGGADGQLSKDEMNQIKSKYSVSKSSEKLITSFMKIKGHQDMILKVMTTLFAGNIAVLELVINNLMTLAEADGEVSQSEIREIHSIGKKLGLSKESVQNIIENQNTTDDEGENVRYFDEDFFPEFEEIMD